MIDHRYTLIRYVADPSRMEPKNVGIILQGQGQLQVRFSPHAAKRKDIDTAAFGKWKRFLTLEVDGPSEPLFQPDRSSPQFLRYLAELCDAPISLSRPLSVSTSEGRTFSQLLDDLFTRLVLPPEHQSPIENSRPTGRFRTIADEKRFVDRGLKKYVHIPLAEPQRWTAYRQVLNGEYIAVDKVEVARELGRTADEINKLMFVRSLLKNFVEQKIQGKNTRYVLLADELTEKFSEQTPEEFDAMRDDLEKTVKEVKDLGGQVLRNPSESEKFALELDKKLPEHPSAPASAS